MDRHAHRRSEAPTNPPNTHLTWANSPTPTPKHHPADSGIRHPSQRPGPKAIPSNTNAVIRPAKTK